jgi:hypothetical protein
MKSASYFLSTTGVVTQDTSVKIIMILLWQVAMVIAQTKSKEPTIDWPLKVMSLKYERCNASEEYGRSLS